MTTSGWDEELNDSERDTLYELVDMACQEYLASINQMLSTKQNICLRLEPLVRRLVEATARTTQLEEFHLQKIQQVCTKFGTTSSSWENHQKNVKECLWPLLLQLVKDVVPSSSALLLSNPNSKDANVRMEGWLRKKGQHVHLWHDRYFVLRSVMAPDGITSTGHHILCYYRKKSDKEPRDWYILGPECTVDEVRESPSKIETKRLFTFRIRNYSLGQAAVQSESTASMDLSSTELSLSTRSEHEFGLESTTAESGEFEASYKRRQRKKRAKKAAAAAAAATAVVLTGGLAAAGMSAAAATAAAGAGVGALFVGNKSKGSIALAAESKEVAEEWTKVIMECVAESEEQWSHFIQNVSPRSVSVGKIPLPIANSLRNSIAWSANQSWSVYESRDSLNIYEEQKNNPGEPPVLKASLVILSSAETTFELLKDLDSTYYKTNPMFDQVRRVTMVDSHSDIVYIRLAPMKIWPIVAMARDFCLVRHWRTEENGSHIICFDSTTHPECPIVPHCVRGKISGGGFIISPRVDSGMSESECLVTLVCQIDPSGFLGGMIGKFFWMNYSFAAKFLEQIITAADVLLYDQYEFIQPRKYSAIASTSDAAIDACSLVDRIDSLPDLQRQEMLKTHAGNVPRQHWAEPPASKFRLRGRNFFTDGLKIESEESIFCLFAVDIVECDNETASRNIGAHPNSIPRRLESEFVLIINFIVPGPPVYSLILYFVPVVPKALEDGSPSSELCREFFNRDDDEYRNARLKVIPSVVNGPWLIHQGVGTTPTLLGHKINQSYHRGNQYFEVDCDIGSSSVASGVVRILSSNCQHLVIDIAFVLQANREEELPERVLACARLDSIVCPM